MTAPATPQRFNMRQLKVMVVDDTQSSLDIMTHVLMGFGIRQYTTCRTVSEAAATLEVEAFDMVIVDGEMPDQDGFDLTQRLRSDQEGPNFTIPIIIASGHTPRSKIERARDIGANMVVLKPIVPDVLLNRIEWMAKSPREFVISPEYCGPDRRPRGASMLKLGADDRRADPDRLMSQPERELSQSDIDSLFD